MSYHLLIADDDPDILIYYRQLFVPGQSLDVDVETFSGGEALVERFGACFERDDRIPICILDMRMPGMNGLQTARALRAIDPEVILIIITGYADVPSEDFLKNLKEDIYYLQKPFEEQELLLLLNSLIKSWAHQNENKHLLEETQRNLEELKKNQDKLYASEQLYRTMLFTSPDGVCVTDLIGTVTYVSQKVLSMFGFSTAEEVEGKNIFRLLEPDYRKKAFIMVQEMKQGSYAGVSEYVARKKDGSRLHVEGNAEILRDEAGQAVGIFFIIRDITARKQIEQAEREQRNLAEALRETAAALNSTLNFDDLIDCILLNVGWVVPHDFANIMLVDKHGEARIARSRGYAKGEVTRLMQDIHFPVKN